MLAGENVIVIAFFENMIGVAVLLIFVFFGLLAVFDYTLNREYEEKRRQGALYINGCVDEANLGFGVTFPKYILRDKALHINYQRKVVTPQGEYALYINGDCRQAAIVKKEFDNNRLVSVEIYRKSNVGTFERTIWMSRKNYINFMLREGYSFGQYSAEMLYNGLCDANTEDFLIHAYLTCYFIRYWEPKPYTESGLSWCEDFSEAWV